MFYTKQAKNRVKDKTFELEIYKINMKKKTLKIS